MTRLKKEYAKAVHAPVTHARVIHADAKKFLKLSVADAQKTVIAQVTKTIKIISNIFNTLTKWHVSYVPFLLFGLDIVFPVRHVRYFSIPRLFFLIKAIIR